MRILILGAGAVGSFAGARLALAGHKVVLVGRPVLAAAVQAAGGLTLIGPDGQAQAMPGIAAATSVVGALAAYGDYDLGFLTAKAYDTAAAAGELQAAGGHGPFVTLQNGIGNEETLAAVLGADAVISAALDTPVSVPAPGQVQVHRPRYRFGLAPVGGAAELPQVQAVLAGAGFEVRSYADYRSLKWTKLLLNLPANASCAILDWTPRQVMKNGATARLEGRAWQEALAVMAALGIRPVKLAGYPIPLLAPLARRLPPGLLARGLRRFVSGGRGSKSPSLQLALRSGRPSEVAWLNGAVARYGRQAGVATPVNDLYTRLVTELTDGRARLEDYRGQPRRLLAALAAR